MQRIICKFTLVVIVCSVCTSARVLANLPLEEGSYRTTSAGTWSSATWEVYAGNWTASAPPPANTSSPVFIWHSISANTSLTLDYITIENNGNLIITNASTINRSIIVETGGSLEVSAGFNNIGLFTVRTGGLVIVNHSAISGVSSLWSGTENFEPGSGVEIRNWAYNAPADEACLIQNPGMITPNAEGSYFGNLIIGGAPTSPFIIVAGSQTIKLCSNNLAVSTTGGAAVILTKRDSKITIGENLLVNSSQFGFASTTVGNPVTTINGSIVCKSGIVNLNLESSGNTASIVQLRGNLEILAGANLNSTDGGCKVIFSGSVAQTVNIAGNLGTNVTFEVATGATARLINQNLVLVNPSNTIDVLSGGVLDFNGFDVAGPGDFNVSAGGILRITSANGVNASGHNTGNVINTGKRSFSQSAHFYFAGAVTPQYTGTAMSLGSSAKRIVIDKVNATDIVYVSQSTGTTDSLIILNGTLVETETANISGSGSLSMYGGFYKTAVTQNVVPQLLGTYNVSGGTIELSAAGNQVLRGSTKYMNITFSGGGIKSVTTGVPDILGTLTIDNNVTLNGENKTIGGQFTNLVMLGNSKFKIEGVSTKPDARGNYSLAPTSTIEFANSASTLQTIRLNRVYGNIIISGSNVGTSTITGSIDMLTGTTFTVKSSGVFKVANTNGLSGASNTAINNTNNPLIILEPGSTIEYNKDVASQVITGRTDYSNLTLSNASVKTMAGTYTVAGNFTVSGGAVTAPAVMNFAGSLVTQNISGINWNNITFSGTALKQFTSDGSLSGTLSMTGNNVVLDADGPSDNVNFTLKSTSITSTARVNDLSNGGTTTGNSILGNVIVERFIPAKRSYRFLSPGVTTTRTIFDNWQEKGSGIAGFGTHITGEGGSINGFDPTATNNPSLYYYVADKWTPAKTTNSDRLYAGKAYRLFVRGDRTINMSQSNPQATPTVLRAKGTLLTGNVTYNTDSVVNTPKLNDKNNKFSFIGNPYASAINWDAIVNYDNVTQQIKGSLIDLSSTYYTIDPTLSNAFIKYASYNAVTGETAPANSTVNKYIQPGQAFFVKTVDQATNASPNPSITFRESYKATELTSVYRMAAERPKLTINLLIDDTVQSPVDGLVVVFDESFKTSIGMEDSYKLTNQMENIAINRNGTLLCIEGRSIISDTDTLPLKVWQFQSNRYALKIKAVNFFRNQKAFLKDAYLNKITPINLQSATTVPFEINNDSASFAPDRFMIVIKPVFSLPITISDLKAYFVNKGILLNWKTSTETNLKEYIIEKSANGSKFDSIALVRATANGSERTYSWWDPSPVTGINHYRLRASGSPASTTYSSIVKVNFENIKSAVSVYPNPVINNRIGLAFANMKEGKYYLNLYNQLGQTVFSTYLLHNGASNNYSVNTGKEINSGSYKLTISKGETVETISLIFKE